MRHKGRVARWHDDKGYGFIAPCLPGPEVFLQIKAFGQLHKRPQVGDLLTYTLSQDERGRPRAGQVAYSREKFVPKPSRSVGTRRPWAVPFALAVLIGIAVAAALDALPIEIAGLYWVASTVAFVFYGWDKASAARAVRRTPENTLLIVGLIGGWPGALIAQEVLRHKTAKASFQSSFWITVFVNIAVLVWVLLDPHNVLTQILQMA